MGRQKEGARTHELFNLAMFFALAVVMGTQILFPSEPVVLTPVVNTTRGPIQGLLGHSRDNQEYWQFLGIPYAKPPVGDKKFALPEPIEPWSSVKPVTSYAPSCAQLDLFLTFKPQGQLDCLYLNVFVNVQNGFETNQSKPVIIYLHGGAWLTGSTEMHQPEYFMDQDIVLVVIGYRLGPYGFLNLKDVPGAPEGNMAMFDQILAMKWVQQNIASFGGNPNKVTLFGESAGSMSAEFHILSPLSQGLFQRAILQSSNTFAPFAYNQDQRPIARNYSKKMGCQVENDIDVWECFQNADWKEVVKYHETLLNPVVPKDFFQPTIDNKFLIDKPQNLFEKGNFTKVPVMIGVHHNEGGIRAGRFDAMPEAFLQLEENFDELIGNYMVMEKPIIKALAEKITEMYFSHGKLTEDLNATKKGLNDLISDNGFLYPAHKSAVYYAKAGMPVYMYYFNYSSKIYPSTYSGYGAIRQDDWLPGPVKIAWKVVADWFNGYTRPYGVSHGEMVYQVWNVLGYGKYFASWDQDFSRSFVKAIVDFANDTSPLKFRDVQWPTINKNVTLENDEYSIPYMLMDNENVPKVIPEPNAERIKFWANLEEWEF